jgi:hypothetical protein
MPRHRNPLLSAVSLALITWFSKAFASSVKPMSQKNFATSAEVQSDASGGSPTIVSDNLGKTFTGGRTSSGFDVALCTHATASLH